MAPNAAPATVTPFPGPGATEGAEEVWLVLLPGFSLLALAGTLEPLRLANRAAGRELYRWRLLAGVGAAAVSADGAEVAVEDRPALRSGAAAAPTIVLCGGIGGGRCADGELLAWLRRWARFGARIGAIGSATQMLARAGLLARCRCTTHWQSLAALAEAFPELDASGNLFEVGPDRFTGAGGAATLDLALHRIALAHERELADRVAEACVLDRPRVADAPQRQAREARLNALHPKLALLARLMEANVEEPLTQGQLASRVGLSRRQVERLFQRHLGRTPSQHYLGVRLERARVLLAETDLPVVGVACATGFVSASHFATCYRQHFGRTPRMERLRVA